MQMQIKIDLLDPAFCNGCPIMAFDVNDYGQPDYNCVMGYTTEPTERKKDGLVFTEYKRPQECIEENGE